MKELIETVSDVKPFLKVLFEEGTKKVIGVEYSRHGKTKIAYAKKEVIISAGEKIKSSIN